MKRCVWCGEEIKPVDPKVAGIGEGPYETDFGPVCDVSCAVDAQIHFDPLCLVERTMEDWELLMIIRDWAGVEIKPEEDGGRISFCIHLPGYLDKPAEIVRERMERVHEMLSRAGVEHLWNPGQKMIFIYSKAWELAS